MLRSQSGFLDRGDEVLPFALLLVRVDLVFVERVDLEGLVSTTPAAVAFPV
jgi:hypothetical protein